MKNCDCSSKISVEYDLTDQKDLDGAGENCTDRKAFPGNVFFLGPICSSGHLDGRWPSGAGIYQEEDEVK